MVMSWIWAFLLLVSITFAWLTGRGAALAGAVMQGAQAGVTLAISMAGAICLWSGVGNLMEHIGVTDRLAGLLRPLLGRLRAGNEGRYQAERCCTEVLRLHHFR